MGRTWVERHPHPGEAPPKPSGEHPTEAASLEAWWSARRAWDDYVVRLRRHQVAHSIDQLDASGDPPRPEQMIARILGASWLDGTLGSAQLFGGIL